MTTATTQTPPREQTAWLRERLAHIVRRTRIYHQGDPELVIVTHLSGGLTPTPTQGSREDRTCDRCRTYTPPGQPGFWLVGIRHRPWLIICGGLCDTCYQVESVDGIPS